MKEADVVAGIVTRHVSFGGKGSTCKAIGPPLSASLGYYVIALTSRFSLAV